MKLVATPSSAQARAAAKKLTEYCQLGEHPKCAGHVYVGHCFEEGAQHKRCACTCHHALPKAA